MKNYSDLKLHQKISIVMATIFLSLAIILTSISLMMFTSFYEKEATDIATQWARVSERNISQIWSNISERVLKTVVKGDFVTKITNTKLSELQKRVDLQDSIENINSSSSFIYSSFFLTENNETIYSFNDIPTDKLDNFTFDKLKADPENIEEIAEIPMFSKLEETAKVISSTGNVKFLFTTLEKWEDKQQLKNKLFSEESMAVELICDTFANKGYSCLIVFTDGRTVSLPLN